MDNSSVLSEGLLDVGSGSPSATQVEQVSPETEQVSTSSEGSQEATPNWDDPSNPYLQQAQENERRFKGLQGTVQQYAEQLRAVREEQRQAEERQFLSSIQNLPPVQQQQQIDHYRQQQQAQVQVQDFQQKQAQLEAASREFFIQKFTADYGVPRNEIEDFSDPVSMQRYAQRYKDLMSRTQAQQSQVQRQVQQMDRFESTQQSASAPRRSTTDFDEAGQNFAAEFRRRFGS